MTESELSYLNSRIMEINQRYFSVIDDIRQFLIRYADQLGNNIALLDQFLNERLDDVSYLYDPRGINTVLSSNDPSVPSSNNPAVPLSGQEMLNRLRQMRDRVLAERVHYTELLVSDIGISFNPFLPSGYTLPDD